MNRKTKKRVFFLLPLFLIIGLSFRLNKRYEYNRPEMKFNDGRIMADFEWTARLTWTANIFGPPYELFIWIDLNEKQNGSVTIVNLELQNIHTGEIVFKEDGPLNEKLEFNEYDGKYCATFWFKGLEFDYERYKLNVNFKVESDKQSYTQKASLVFEKKYKQYISNFLLDILKA